MSSYFRFLQRFVEVIDGKLCFILPIDEYLLKFFIYYSSIVLHSKTVPLLSQEKANRICAFGAPTDL